MSAPSWCHSAGILGGGGCSRTFRRWWALDKRPQTSIGEPDQRLSEEVPAGDEFDSAFADRTADRALPTTASKCAAATVFPSDAPVAYNHAYGVLIRGEGRFPLTGNYTTILGGTAKRAKSKTYVPTSLSTPQRRPDGHCADSVWLVKCLLLNRRRAALEPQDFLVCLQRREMGVTLGLFDRAVAHQLFHDEQLCALLHEP